jgi:hypothetical protein
VPRLIDSHTRTGAMVLAINHILVTQGVFGLTLRTIARESGFSTGSLLHHFGHRERVLGVAAYQTGRSLQSEIGSGAVRHGVEAFLPMDDEGVLLTRAWLSWCELWRSEDWLTETVGDLRAQERGMLAEAHDFQGSVPTSTCWWHSSTGCESRCVRPFGRCRPPAPGPSWPPRPRPPSSVPPDEDHLSSPSTCSGGRRYARRAAPRRGRGRPRRASRTAARSAARRGRRGRGGTGTGTSSRRRSASGR